MNEGVLGRDYADRELLCRQGEPGDRMFVTDFAGSIYYARLNGSGERNFLFAQGTLTGVHRSATPSVSACHCGRWSGKKTPSQLLLKCVVCAHP